MYRRGSAVAEDITELTYIELQRKDDDQQGPYARLLSRRRSKI
jgi:hypothetical protein